MLHNSFITIPSRYIQYTQTNAPLRYKYNIYSIDQLVKRDFNNNNFACKWIACSVTISPLRQSQLLQEVGVERSIHTGCGYL